MLIFVFVFMSQVHYTGLESHPDYDIHMAQASGGGSVVCFRTGSLAFSQHIVTVRCLCCMI